MSTQHMKHAMKKGFCCERVSFEGFNGQRQGKKPGLFNREKDQLIKKSLHELAGLAKVTIKKTLSKLLYLYFPGVLFFPKKKISFRYMFIWTLTMCKKKKKPSHTSPWGQNWFGQLFYQLTSFAFSPGLCTNEERFYAYSLGTPDTRFKGPRTLLALSVLKSTEPSSTLPGAPAPPPPPPLLLELVPPRLSGLRMVMYLAFSHERASYMYVFKWPRTSVRSRSTQVCLSVAF